MVVFCRGDDDVGRQSEFDDPLPESDESFLGGLHRAASAGLFLFGDPCLVHGFPTVRVGAKEALVLPVPFRADAEPFPDIIINPVFLLGGGM